LTGNPIKVNTDLNNSRNDKIDLAIDSSITNIEDRTNTTTRWNVR